MDSIWEFLTLLFNDAGFGLHKYCMAYHASPWVAMLSAVSDIGTAFCYLYLIPRFLKKIRSEIEISPGIMKYFFLFEWFIGSCGAIHLSAFVTNMFYAFYRFEAIMKLNMLIVSLATGILGNVQIPKYLAAYRQQKELVEQSRDGTA